MLRTEIAQSARVSAKHAALPNRSQFRRASLADFGPQRPILECNQIGPTELSKLQQQYALSTWTSDHALLQKKSVPVALALGRRPSPGEKAGQ